ncbi:MAG: protein phosphatase 2C domain-containing protein [Gammaproteobacteria bacterium]|nr:protein phosphatase 2C domain-containing protein [Gammaproteobacteria bacterium]
MSSPAPKRSNARFERLYCAYDQIFERIDCGGLGQVVVYTSRAPDNSSENEDGAAVIEVDDRRLVLAVSDGVGGLPGGNKASSAALESLRACIVQARASDQPLREAILSGFDRANHAVAALAGGPAATLAVVEVDGRSVRTYHVGDSGVLVFGGRGKMRLQTIFHSPVGYAIEAGVLDEEDAIEHEDRHIVSNVIGDPAMHVGMSSALKLKLRDTLVIASDGLFDNLYTQEIVETLRRGELSGAVQSLADGCHARMAGAEDGSPSKPDDLTMVVFRAHGG